MTYVMPQKPLQDVLKRDQELLTCLIQPELVDYQLGKLIEELGVGVELEGFLEDLGCPPTDDEISDSETNIIEFEEKIAKEKQRRKAHLEKMSIFMEAEAPFPEPDSHVQTLNLMNNIYGSPKYSKDGSGSQTSETDGSSSLKQPTKRVRFGKTSSLGG